MKTRSDCVVVFKDVIERRMRVQMDRNFEGMQTLPTVIVRDDPTASDPIEPSDFRQIMLQNPENCSVWLREGENNLFRLAAKPGVDPASLMSNFFKTEVLRRFSDLALTLQDMGVRSIAGRASEKKDEHLSKDNSLVAKASGSKGITKASADFSTAQENAESFKHDVEQSVTYSIDAPLDVSFDDMKNVAAMRGFENEPIIKMVLSAKRKGPQAWNSLIIEHKIDATVVQSLNEKIDFALSVSAKLPIGEGVARLNSKGETEMLSKIVQNFEICVRNKI